MLYSLAIFFIGMYLGIKIEELFNKIKEKEKEREKEKLNKLRLKINSKNKNIKKRFIVLKDISNNIKIKLWTPSKTKNKEVIKNYKFIRRLRKKDDK